MTCNSRGWPPNSSGFKDFFKKALALLAVWLQAAMMSKEIWQYREFGRKELPQDFTNLQPSLQLLIPAPLSQIKASSVDLCVCGCMESQWQQPESDHRSMHVSG